MSKAPAALERTTSAAPSALEHTMPTAAAPLALATTLSADGPHAPKADEEPAPLPSQAPLDLSALPHGAAVGRYLLLERVGQGGLGVVYKAYDRELDRRVAIKLVRARKRRGEDQREARLRLVREAQALGKLDHPNVVPVHDVGTHGDDVYIAMAFLEGQTLGAWLREPRPLADVLAVFAAAGQGLLAAHRAGLVHRDFKPDNVLVGNDGSVRVLDFGLARPADGAGLAESSDPSEPNAAPGRVSFHAPLTRIGARVGTPLYMAPEQHLGQRVDARCDQFSFCVALYEAVYGERPFADTSLDDLVRAVTSEAVRPPRPGVPVPRWLRKLLLRGLRVRPDDRYADMGALLEELDRGRQQRRGRPWVAAVAVLGALVIPAAATSFVLRPKTATVCRGGEEMLRGVWDDARREQLRGAFTKTSLPYAEDAFRSVERAFDRRAAGWLAMRKEACEATRVRGEQSEDLLDLRTSCLDLRREELRATVDVLASATPDVVERAAQTALELPALETCADAVALRRPGRRPMGSAEKAQVFEVRARLAEQNALVVAGRAAEARRMIPATMDAVKPLGDPGLEAEALLSRAKLEEAMGEYRGAEATLRSAWIAAERAKDDELVATARTQLVAVVGDHLGRGTEGDELVRLADAAVDGLDRPGELRKRLSRTTAALRIRQGKYESAIELARRALEAEERATGTSPLETAATLTQLGSALWSAGKNAEALPIFRRAVALREEILGRDHPMVAVVLANMANVAGDLGDHAAARAYEESALAILSRVYGPEHPQVATLHNNLGDDLRALGLFDEARARYTEALAIWTRSFGAHHPQLAVALYNLGELSLEVGRLDEARGYFERALAVRRPAVGENHPHVARDLTGLGDALREAGQLAAAQESYQRARAVWQATGATTHPDAARTLVGLARVRLARDEPAKAVELLRAAVGVLEGGQGEPVRIGEARFVLAQALVKLSRQSGAAHEAEAIELAEKARESFLAAGESRRKSAAEVDHWLAARRVR